jgi:hypothetical protein
MIDLEGRVRDHLHARLAAVPVPPGTAAAVRPSQGRRWLAPAVAAAVVIVAAGIGVWATWDGDDTGAPLVVTDDPATTTTPATSASTTASPTTTEMTGVPTTSLDDVASAGSARVDVVEWTPARVGPIVGLGDGFVTVYAGEPGGAVVRRSADGRTWDDVPSDLNLQGVSQLDADGDRLLVVGWREDFVQPWAGISTDGGATWTGTDLPGIDGEVRHAVRRQVYVADAALGPDGAVIVGAIVDTIDWRALAIEVTGVDHGEFNGGGGGDSTSYTVTYEDGAEIEYDLEALGLPAPSMIGAPASAWTWDDGGGWERSEPFGAASVYAVVHGPLGFVAHTQRADGSPDFNQLHDFNQLQRSADGRTWQPGPVPDGYSNVEALVASSDRYVLVADGDVLTSSDAITWEVARTRNGPERVMVSVPSVAAAGAGVVVALSEVAMPESYDDFDPSDQTLVVVWSPDGVTWEPIELPDPTAHVEVAVSDTRVLVLADDG